MMQYHNEGFRGKIRDSLMEREISEVSMLLSTLLGRLLTSDGSTLVTLRSS